MIHCTFCLFFVSNLLNLLLSLGWSLSSFRLRPTSHLNRCTSLPLLLSWLFGNWFSLFEFWYSWFLTLRSARFKWLALSSSFLNFLPHLTAVLSYRQRAFEMSNNFDWCSSCWSWRCWNSVLTTLDQHLFLVVYLGCVVVFCLSSWCWWSSLRLIFHKSGYFNLINYSQLHT